MYITTNLELKKFCDSLCNERFISIDTEFCRDKTYYPQLCLIQIASKNSAVIIDPLNEALDLNVLNSILQNPEIIKVFHSAKQDLEIMLLLFKELPKNIFDTQIAASFCGIGNSISYESLVGDLLGVKIDKSHCLSDWTKRPLSKQQIDYALGDVIYLYKIYPKLISLLEENNRMSWAEEEINNLNLVDNFFINMDQAWSKLKNPNRIKINLVIKRLAAWRELQARKFNLPRNHYLKEQYLFDLARILPITLVELKRIKYFEKISDDIGQEIVSIIQDALNEQTEIDLSGEFLDKPKINITLLSKLKILLTSKAEEYSLPSSLISTTQDLKNFCDLNYSDDSRILSGWRYQVFGKEAINLK